MPQRVPMMDCADSMSRADNGIFGKGPVAKKTSYSISAAQTGTVFSNAAAGAAVTFTLPTPVKGFFFVFLKAAAQNLLIKAPAGSKVGGSVAGKILQNVTNGDAGTGVCALYCDGTDYWLTYSVGTWAANNA